MEDFYGFNINTSYAKKFLMGKLRISQELLRVLVNEKVSFVNTLSKLNPESRYDIGRPTFCPFHDNENTPAAVIYDDEKGETLWCFSEQKLYYPADLVSKILQQDSYAIGLQIWNTLDDFSQQEFLAKHGDFSIASFDDTSKVEPDKLEQQKYLFKHGKLTYSELMAEYKKYL